MSGSISPPLLDTVARRASIISHLLENPSDKRELVAQLNVSRTTISRAISSLDDAGCVAYRNGNWEVTLLGRLAYRTYEQLAASYDSLAAARPLLLHLSPKTPLDVRLLTGAEIILAEPPAPHVPVARLEDLLEDSRRIEGISSVVLPKYVPLFYHHVVERGVDTDLVLDSKLVEYLRSNYHEELDGGLEADNGTIREIDRTPRFGLVLVDEAVVWFAVYDRNAGLKGAIVNDSQEAVAWAGEVIRSYRGQAERVPAPDGSPVAVSD